MAKKYYNLIYQIRILVSKEPINKKLREVNFITQQKSDPKVAFPKYNFVKT